MATRPKAERGPLTPPLRGGYFECRDLGVKVLQVLQVLHGLILCGSQQNELHNLLNYSGFVREEKEGREE